MRVLPTGRTENGGRCSSTTVENRTGRRKRRRVFDPVQYCPLVLRRVQTVEIYIRDDTGVKIQFERGCVVVTHHCKRRKELYLEWSKQPNHCQAKEYHDYNLHQAGRGYPVYDRTRYQRGHGLGSIFENLFKSAVPLLKRGAKPLDREALKTGLNLPPDVMEEQNVTQAAKSRLKSTGQNLLQKAIDTVGPPGERSIKRVAKRKKPRRR